jgi:predicted regulator of Ras-like GTPase activity (Roadblock/LC7/MglB family)
MFPTMDAQEALEELLRVSDDVRAAVVFERGGTPIAATIADDRAAAVAEWGDAMLAYADTLRDGPGVERLEAATRAGSVFVVRDGDRAVVAVADPTPVTRLVHHDLRTLLGKLSRTPRRRKAAAPA